MKAKNLGKIAGITIPIAGLVSGCAGTVKGLSHDVGYWSTKISNSIELKEQPTIVDSPKRLIPDGQGGYIPYNPKTKYNLSPRK